MAPFAFHAVDRIRETGDWTSRCHEAALPLGPSVKPPHPSVLGQDDNQVISRLVHKAPRCRVKEKEINSKTIGEVLDGSPYFSSVERTASKDSEGDDTAKTVCLYDLSPEMLQATVNAYLEESNKTRSTPEPRFDEPIVQDQIVKVWSEWRWDFDSKGTPNLPKIYFATTLKSGRVIESNTDPQGMRDFAAPEFEATFDGTPSPYLGGLVWGILESPDVK
jgi:hypothetical protein